MRIIAGRFRGRRLVAPKGLSTRPTTDRTRESLFNLLGDVSGLIVADLFAGSGALGLEAMSRGASKLVAVESSPKAIKTIRANVDALGLDLGVKVLKRTISTKFDFLKPVGPFDLILADPPYDQGWVQRLLTGLDRSVISGAGRLVVETSTSEAPSQPQGWRIVKKRRYGDSVITILTLES